MQSVIEDLCVPVGHLAMEYVDIRAYLHEGGGPQVGEVTCVKLPHLTCKRDHIKIRDLDRRVTPPKRVTSPTWDPPPPCKQALRPMYQSEMFLRSSSVQFKISPATNSLYEMSKV